jgi:hypothetical protein
MSFANRRLAAAARVAALLGLVLILGGFALLWWLGAPDWALAAWLLLHVRIRFRVPQRNRGRSDGRRLGEANRLLVDENQSLVSFVLAAERRGWIDPRERDVLLGLRDDPATLRRLLEVS